jgi:hypothetical protein
VLGAPYSRSRHRINFSCLPGHVYPQPISLRFPFSPNRGIILRVVGPLDSFRPEMPLLLRTDVTFKQKIHPRQLKFNDKQRHTLSGVRWKIHYRCFGSCLMQPGVTLNNRSAHNTSELLETTSLRWVSKSISKRRERASCVSFLVGVCGFLLLKQL